MLRKSISAVLTVCMLTGGIGCGMSVSAAETENKSVADYTYKITPLLAPFNEYFFVETDNPDPKSFRFSDKSSVYSDEATICFDWDDWNEKIKLYADIKYDDETTARVNGGYIFRSFSTDGGEVVLQSRIPGRYSWDDTWEDTNVKLTLEKLEDDKDYLIDTYANGDTFFEKMDAVQKGFESICLYSGSYIRGNIVKTSKYWEVVTAGHSDQSFYIYSPYSRKDNISLFSSAIYPFRYDSLGFPGVMGTVSKRLDSSSSYKWNSNYHWLIDVTCNDQTKSYGGAGNIEGQGLTEDKLKKFYTFGKNGTKIDLKETFDLQKEYSEIKMDDDIPREDALTWNKLCETADRGAWCRINHSTKSYAYFYKEDDEGDCHGDEWGVGNNIFYGGSMDYAQNSWVDGRYVNSGKLFEPGAKIEDHPTASIILKNVKVPVFDYEIKYNYNYSTEKYESEYIISNVTEKTKTMKFYYDSEKDKWFAGYGMAHGTYKIRVSYDWLKNITDSGQLDKKYLDNLVLTQDEVKALKVDRNTNKIPSKGYIYDGTTEPGTAFSYASLTNKSSVSADSITLGDTITLTAAAEGSTGSNYTYALMYKKSGSRTWTKIGTKYGTANTGSFTPKTAATYDIMINVKDYAGTVKSKTFTVTVKAPLKNKTTVNSETVKVGEKIVLKGAASGGTAGYKYAFYYKKSKNSEWLELITPYTTKSIAFKPKSATSYDLKSVVKDADGRTTEKVFTVKVTK